MLTVLIEGFAGTFSTYEKIQPESVRIEKQRAPMKTVPAEMNFCICLLNTEHFIDFNIENIIIMNGLISMRKTQFL